MSYSIAYLVLGVYDMTIDTILLCACEDEKLNSSAPGGLYASKELSEHLDHAATKSFASHKKAGESAKTRLCGIVARSAVTRR